MKLLALAVLACVASSSYARELQQATAPAGASYPSLAEAVAAANESAPNLSILLQAVQAANLTGSMTPNTSWTILAPTNDAFTSRLNESLGITPEQLLEPANRETLVNVLSYHVIPSGAVFSSNLTDGQEVPTALAGADPLEVNIDGDRVSFEGAENSATVTVPDIRAGRSVIHVIDDVLLPDDNNDTTNANTTDPAVGGGAAVSGAGAGAAGSRDVDSNTAVGGGSSTNGAVTGSSPAPGTAVGGGASTAQSGAAGAQIPALLLAGSLLVGMLF